MTKFLVNFPGLKHLDLHIIGYGDLTDGRKWELLSKDFHTLKFVFEILLDSIETILDRFRTSFWLIEKRWFVAYQHKYLYTIPYSIFMNTSIDQSFQPPLYTTLLKTSLFYDHVNKLTLEYRLIETGHRLINITTLEIGFEEICIDILEAIVYLNRVINLTLPSLMKKSKMKYLIDSMPYLQSLSIDTVRKRFV